MATLTRFLPSKKFSKKIGIIFLVVLVIFVAWLFMQKKVIEQGGIIVEKIPLKTLVEKDTDNDGVKDWEEALWGTDPTKDNTFTVSDSAYIQKKKGEVAESETATQNTTEADAFAKEFLSTIISMASSGTLTEENINLLAAAYSEKIGKEKTEVVYIYKAADVKIGSTLTEYRKKLTATLAPYIKKGIGNEIDILQTSFSEDGRFIREDELKAAGENYVALGKALMAIQTPKSIGALHLLFANDSNILGTTLMTISTINTDPVNGIVAFSNYKTRSDTFTRDLERIIAYLEENGIIK